MVQILSWTYCTLSHKRHSTLPVHKQSLLASFMGSEENLVAAPSIWEMPSILQNINDFLQHQCQACVVTGGRNFDHLLLISQLLHGDEKKMCFTFVLLFYFSAHLYMFLKPIHFLNLYTWKWTNQLCNLNKLSFCVSYVENDSE